MPLLLVAVVLGVVEGLTEFLPVSSTAHLALAQRLLPSLGPHDASFRIAIQVGAVAAVGWVERARVVGLLSPAAGPGLRGPRGLLLLAVLTAPALAMGWALRHAIDDWQDRPLVIAVALAVGGVALIVLERCRGDRGQRSMDELSWRIAAGIGLFQCLALVPGVSRSGATIAGAMLLGLSRRAATELSFLAAMPVIVAATAYKLWEDPSILTGDGALLLLVGTLTSAVFGVLAVRGFVAFVGRSTMEPFGWYRLALAAVVIACL